MSKAWPFPSLEEFEANHIEYRQGFVNYMISGRGRYGASRFLIDKFKNKEALDGSAIHPFGRIAMARLLLPAIERATSNKTVQFVSIAPGSAFLRLQDDHRRAVVDLRRLAATVLEGLHYVGVIEPGLFDEWALRPGGPPRAFHISWHFHAIVWADGDRDIKGLVRDRTSGIVAAHRDLDAIDVRSIQPDQLVPRALYMTKLPRTEYRIAPKEPTKKPESPRNASPAEVGVLKRKLQPGEKARALGPLVRFSMQELFISGGAGVGVIQHCFARIRPEVQRLVDRANQQHQRRAREA